MQISRARTIIVVCSNTLPHPPSPPYHYMYYCTIGKYAYAYRNNIILLPNTSEIAHTCNNNIKKFLWFFCVFEKSTEKRFQLKLRTKNSNTSIRGDPRTDRTNRIVRCPRVLCKRPCLGSFVRSTHGMSEYVGDVVLEIRLRPSYWFC